MPRRFIAERRRDPYYRAAQREGLRSRAAFKLAYLADRFPIFRSGDRVLDLGAAPGGWTFVIASLGARVTAIDKAPLAENVAAMPGVTWREGSAFAVAPTPVDWLVCDVIAYPDRLLALVTRWIAAGAPRRIVCTLKFQGETDHDAAAAFAAIPGAQVVHLFHNKHELTFLWRRIRA